MARCMLQYSYSKSSTASCVGAASALHARRPARATQAPRRTQPAKAETDYRGWNLCRQGLGCLPILIVEKGGCEEQLWAVASHIIPAQQNRSSSNSGRVKRACTNLAYDPQHLASSAYFMMAAALPRKPDTNSPHLHSAPGTPLPVPRDPHRTPWSTSPTASAIQSYALEASVALEIASSTARAAASAAAATAGSAYKVHRGQFSPFGVSWTAGARSAEATATATAASLVAVSRARQEVQILFKQADAEARCLGSVLFEDEHEMLVRSAEVRALRARVAAQDGELAASHAA
eukprot:6173325-Pleurochrysis_carterae.AAC.1